MPSLRSERGLVAAVAIGAAALAGALAACAAPPDGSGAATSTAAPSAVPSTEAPSTAVPSTAPSSVASTTSTTPAPTVPPTTTIPVTAPPAPLATLTLAPTGLGDIAFGSEPEVTIDAVRAVLGAPTLDTGWTPRVDGSLCPGSEYRRVEWGVLRLDFGDESPFAAGSRHFTAWDYGTEGVVGEEPRGLITARGVGLGARVDELLDAYPETQLSPGEEGVFSAGFEIEPQLVGLITGVEPTDTVMVMFGGAPCGE